MAQPRGSYTYTGNVQNALPSDLTRPLVCSRLQDGHPWKYFEYPFQSAEILESVMLSPQPKSDSHHRVRSPHVRGVFHWSEVLLSAELDDPTES